jgi:hypothetical protein
MTDWSRLVTLLERKGHSPPANPAFVA